MHRLSSRRRAAAMKAFAARFPRVHARLRALKTLKTRCVEGAAGVENIDLGDALLYPAPVDQWTRTRLRSFRDDPDRLVFANPHHCNLSAISLSLLSDLRRYAHDTELLSLLAPTPQVDVGYMFVFGIGLGAHILPLVQETPARRIILIEPILEFVKHSLDACDWKEILDTADARGIDVHLITEKNPQAILNVVCATVSVKGNVFLDGSFFYQDYIAWYFDESMLLIKEKIKAFYNSAGFFEDELEMMRGAAGNISNHTFRTLTEKPRVEQNYPVILVGSGPSLDRDISTLQALRDRAIIVSCGTTLSILLQHGIVPDLHCEIERGEPTYNLLRTVASKFDLRGVVLIAASNVDPRIAPLFGEMWLYTRSGLSPASILTSAVEPLSLVDPLCCNAAFAAMAALGFRNFWLVGLDLGTRTGLGHHARDSLYFQPENADLEKTYRGIFNRPVPGNFGGTVLTSPDFDAGRTVLARAQQRYRTNLVNCSDGARIDGARPKVAAAVDLPATQPLPRQAVLDRVRHSMPLFAAGELVNSDALDPHIEGCNAYLEMLDRVLADWLAADEEFFDLEERLVRAVDDGRERFQGFHMISRGSIMGMLRLGAFFSCRITCSDRRRDFRGVFARQYRERVVEMVERARELLLSIQADFVAAQTLRSLEQQRQADCPDAMSQQDERSELSSTCC